MHARTGLDPLQSLRTPHRAQHTGRSISITLEVSTV
ncbi:unnamed protein product [Mycetohabitans rhizoxinica HKI 454]|uniref:Uncharacterized protein n=1 Tax=Mycetohabitans rhizoxinica (strain DSM 19002 / CIP 109453 / HKI 454) TaxID=882378 RepID=E5AL07_MYCRK|nr:unnamed protein product [Mycetohabitans rhizoxinica HKI 454]